MIKISSILTAFSLLLITPFTMADTMDPQPMTKSTSKLTIKAEQTLQLAGREHFSGKAEFARLPILPSNGDVAPAIVHFKPDSLTHWHSHSQGQYLIVTEGTGRFQEWGKMIQVITKGDVIWIAPNIKHWHGAGELTAMSHIAISPIQDNVVTWLEPVQLEKNNNTIPSYQISAEQFTSQQLVIIPLAVAVTDGNQTAVKAAIINGLKAGLTISELKEVISHQFSYIGAPKTLNGLLTLKALLEEHAEQGIYDPLGQEATEQGNVDYYQLGTQKLAELTGRPTESPIFEFAPAIDYAIKSQLFGYQFSRDNLSDVERELATIGSLVGLGESVNAQLRSHLTVLTRLGLTEKGMTQLSEMINPQQAQNLRAVWIQLKS